MATTKTTIKALAKPKAEKPYELTTADKASMALRPSLNGAAVIQAYQGNIMGKKADMAVLIEKLRETFTEVKGGDLNTMEAMLVGKRRRCKPSSPVWRAGRRNSLHKENGRLF